MKSESAGVWLFVVLMFGLPFGYGSCVKRADDAKVIASLMRVIEEGREQAKSIQEQVKDLGPYTSREKVLEDLDELTFHLNLDRFDSGRED